MRLNGSVQLTKGHDRSYSLSYAPLGGDLRSRRTRRFDDARELERFLTGPLRVARREMLEALTALDHNGRYVIREIWLSVDEATALV